MWFTLLLWLWLAPAHAADRGVPDSSAGWLSRLWPATAATTAPATSLADAARHVRDIAPDPTRRLLAAERSHEGHWRFVNAAGETMTTASPDEMQRAIATLAPASAPDLGMPERQRPPPQRLAVFVPAETALRHGSSLGELPDESEINVVVGHRSWRLVWPGRRIGERFYAVLRPRMVVAVTSPDTFAEVLALLERSIDPANLRAIGLEADGPRHLPRFRPMDAAGRPLVDSVDPASLRLALPSLAGQTAILTGKLERDTLGFRAATGLDRSLPVADIVAAAADADVNLVLVRSPSPRQPGARNWLWLRNELAGIDAAFTARTKADFLDALAANGPPLGVTAADRRGERLSLTIRPVEGLPGVGRGLTGMISEAAAGVTGRIPVTGLDLSVRSLARETELAWRLVPGVPSWVQIALGISFAAGAFGWPVVRTWGRRLWPEEARTEYGSAIGWQAARGVRGVLLIGVFMPLVGVPAALARLMSLAGRSEQSNGKSQGPANNDRLREPSPHAPAGASGAAPPRIVTPLQGGG